MDQAIKTIISEDLSKVNTALNDFIQQATGTFSFPELSRNEQRRNLWKALFNLLNNPEASDLNVSCLSAMRILSRDKTDLENILLERHIDDLLRKAGLKPEVVTEIDEQASICNEALKCLCNLIYNNCVIAAISSKNGTMEAIVKRLKAYKSGKVTPEIRIFDMRILFLLSTLCEEIRPKLKEELHGLSYMIETLELISNEAAKRSDHNADLNENGLQEKYLSDADVDLTCEILKILFNLTIRSLANCCVDEEEEASCCKLVGLLHDFLLFPVQNRNKQLDMHSHIVNLLINMPNSSLKSLTPPVVDDQKLPKAYQYDDINMQALHQLVVFLKNRFDDDLNVKSQSELLSPILTVLQKCVSSDRRMRKYLRQQVLPPLRDVHHRPEEGNTIRNCLCRLLTTPITNVRDLAADFLFILCKENVGRMIKYTGYGNAAGLFANRGLLGGGKPNDETKYSSDSEDSDTEEYKEHRHGINPVVGCYEPPRPSPMANMTEEQKEYEAMKLVNLMDNLTRQGIVQPCRIGEDGRPEPIEHVLQLQEGLSVQQIRLHDDDDDDD